MRLVYLTIGFVSLGLGIIGIPLPILPTTPFLLLSMACFAKSSKRFEKWLYQTKLYQTYVADYRETKSIVVLMFLDADRIPAIIRNMQEHTNPGGYHLIVCAMDTEDYPCQMPFSFTFKEGELAEYYKDWELVKYNENPGHLHRRDENGHRIQLRFATMLAKKK